MTGSALGSSLTGSMLAGFAVVTRWADPPSLAQNKQEGRTEIPTRISRVNLWT